MLLVSNGPNTTSAAPIAYCLPADGGAFDRPPDGFEWHEALSGRAARFADTATAEGAQLGFGRCFLAPDGRPQVLVLRAVGAATVPAALAVVLSLVGALGAGALCCWFRRRLSGDATKHRGSAIALARLRGWGVEASSMAPVLAAGSPQSDSSDAPPARL